MLQVKILDVITNKFRYFRKIEIIHPVLIVIILVVTIKKHHKSLLFDFIKSKALFQN